MAPEPKRYPDPRWPPPSPAGMIGALPVHPQSVSLRELLALKLPATDLFTIGAHFFDSTKIGPRGARKNLDQAIRTIYHSLDEVERNQPLARILGCANSVKALVKTLADETWLGAEPPPGTRLVRSDGSLSRYADASILGPRAHSTFDSLFRAAYRTVDDLPRDQPALARALGCDNALGAIARAAIERGLLPGKIPEGHSWYRPNGAPSRYFSPAIVGPERALQSLEISVQPLVPRLDQILDVEEAARILRVAPSERAVARRCITLGLVDGCASPLTSILRSNGELSLHLDPRVRRRALAINDLRLIVTAQQLSIDDLAQIPQLALPLQCEASPDGILAGLARNGITPHRSAVPTTLTVANRLHPAFDRTATPPLRWHANMSSYLRANYASLDDIHCDARLAEALQCPNAARDIARTIVAERLMPWRVPVGFAVLEVAGGSFYLDEEVMIDPRRIDLNLRRAIRERIGNLDEVSANSALASALRCANDGPTLAATLVEREILPPELPDRHPFTIGQIPSRYFEAAVVGRFNMMRNIESFLRREAPTLDDLPRVEALCALLQIEQTREALAEYVVHFGLLDWRIPPDHNIARTGGSLYFNRTVLGRQRVQSNIQLHLIDRYGANLDAIPSRSKLLASALEVKNSKAAIVRALVERGILPPLPPPGYDPTTTEASVYLNPRMVGHYRAACNRVVAGGLLKNGF